MLCHALLRLAHNGKASQMRWAACQSGCGLLDAAAGCCDVCAGDFPGIANFEVLSSCSLCSCLLVAADD